VIDHMRRENLNVGGEKSGHVIFMDYATTGDGIITALQVLKLMKLKGAPLDQLAACMEEYPQKLVSLDVRKRKPLDAMPRLSEALAAGKIELGGDGRFVVRYSGTENKIRLLVEARSEDQVDRWIAALSDAVGKDLDL
jgi:phosphoglucosamine mutase